VHAPTPEIRHPQVSPDARTEEVIMNVFFKVLDAELAEGERTAEDRRFAQWRLERESDVDAD
jgi:hypothetical protein